MVYKNSAQIACATAGNISHVFHDPVFWQHFQQQVLYKAWSCNFSTELLVGTLEKDALLYKDDTIFRKRRFGAARWITNDTLWTTLILGASKELAAAQRGPYCQELKDLRMLDAFADFVDHIDFFYRVASEMKAKGQPVTAFSQEFSQVHDIDKLDPIMIVGYSERFEDNVSTSVWDLCVDRHVQVNPHHQGHCLWHGCCQDQGISHFCEDTRTMVLREMVCDKVSRRVQKNLEGNMTPEMWDVELNFFNGLPQDWLNQAVEMMNRMKMEPTKLKCV